MVQPAVEDGKVCNEYDHAQRPESLEDHILNCVANGKATTNLDH